MLGDLNVKAHPKLELSDWMDVMQLWSFVDQRCKGSECKKSSQGKKNPVTGGDKV